MSFLGKKWVIRNEKKELGLIDKMLENRGLLTDEEKYSFFNYSLKKLHDPFLLKDVGKAAERIRGAVTDGEKIMVFGDYDVDGTSATALMLDFLRRVGAKVEFTLPDREKDGYGLKDYFIRQFAKNGVKLVITVDCGTANVAEIELAKELGVEVIVTDHHDIPEVLPRAYALINPKQQGCKYPNKELSGSAVVFKLISVLAPYYLEEQEAEKYLYRQMGIAILGVIADCMKLTGENRVLVNNGLKSLSGGSHPGITALLREAGMDTTKITSTTVGYFLGPRINAAGRLDSAQHALELLLGDEGKVNTLSDLNTKRQNMVKKFVEEAKKQVRRTPDSSGVEETAGRQHILVVSSPEWPSGTLGLIAGKLVDLYHRPAIAMQEKENEFVASCRSLNDFDITAFLRKEAEGLFTSVGGHMLAGGFVMPKKNRVKFLKAIRETAADYIHLDTFHGILALEGEISSSELSFAVSENIRKFEPFGNGNPEPALLVRNVKITDIKPVGKQSEHLQFPVQLDGKKFQAIAFRFAEHLDKIKPENTYDIAFHLETNEWQGYKKLQLRVVDIKETEK